MANSFIVQTTNNFRNTYFEDGTIRTDRILPAIIVEIHWEIGKGCAANGKEYWQATVKIELPTGSRMGPALLWDELLFADENRDMEEEIISEGTEILLAITCDSEDAGNATIEVPYFHIKYKNLHDNGFRGVELTEEKSYIDSEEDVIQEAEDVEQTISVNNRPYKNIPPREETTDNNHIKSQITVATASDETKQKEVGCGKTIFVIVLSFLLTGLVLSPFSFLGFLLYPIWVGSAFLLGRWIFDNFASTDKKR